MHPPIRAKGRLDPYFIVPTVFVGILGIAVVFRVIYLIELSSTPFFRHPVLDAQYYLRWGGQLAWGGFGVCPGFQGNALYPYFLAFLIRFLNAGPLLIRIVQHGLGVITCLLIFRSGKVLFGGKTGLLAALFYAIYIPAIFYEGWFLSASLTTFLVAALLCALLAARENFRRENWIGSGVIAGVLILARPTLLPLGILLWIIFAFKKKEPGRALRPLLFLAGILIIIIPAAIYFGMGSGEGGVISSHGGENFYIGNNPEATGAGRIPDFARGTPALQHDDFLREAERRAGRNFTPGENSRFWFREGIQFIAGHPFAFLKLLVFKIYLFFSANAISDNYHLPFFKDQLPILRLPFSWHVLSTLSILGMIAGWRRRKNVALLYILTGCYVASISIFFITSRFRLPVAPLFAIFGAFGVISIWNAVREKRKKAAAVLIIAAALIFFVLGRLPETTPIYASYLSAGEIYYRDVDYDHALSYLEKARDTLKEAGTANQLRSYRIHYALGQAYLGLNQPVKAAEEFQLLVRESQNNLLEPDFDIGNAYAAHKFYREANDHYLAVLQASPDHFQAWNNLGMVYKEAADFNSAIESFTEAIRINPEYSAPHTNLGNLYVLQEQYEAALNEFRAALRIDPALLQLHLSSAFCLQKLNRLTEAEAEMRRCPAALRRKN
jgi:tetratricopeptide (TPR) repeat protein